MSSAAGGCWVGGAKGLQLIEFRWCGCIASSNPACSGLPAVCPQPRRVALRPPQNSPPTPPPNSWRVERARRSARRPSAPTAAPRLPYIYMQYGASILAQLMICSYSCAAWSHDASRVMPRSCREYGNMRQRVRQS